MIRRFAGLVAALALSFAAVAPVVVASAQYDPFQNPCSQGGSTSTVCTSRSGDDDPIAGSNGAIVNVTSILALIVGFVSVAFVVWGGFKYITSGGDSGGVSSAKNTIIAALVGLVLAIMARPIILFVVGKL
jgi:hypothetical protein